MITDFSRQVGRETQPMADFARLPTKGRRAKSAIPGLGRPAEREKNAQVAGIQQSLQEWKPNALGLTRIVGTSWTRPQATLSLTTNSTYFFKQLVTEFMSTHSSRQNTPHPQK